MRLQPEEAGLFFQMFLPLLDYVNKKYHVTAKPVHFMGESINTEDAAEVAQFLWERTNIIDDYLLETVLPKEQKEIMLSWKRCIPGTFIIERHLKKGSIFISSDNNFIYLVKGITSSWEEMFSGIPTPIIVNTALLPFRDVIISDGLVSTFPVRFDKNSAAAFKDAYLIAKKNKTIITRI